MLCAQQILLFYCDFVLSSWARSFLWALLPLLHHPSMAAQLMSEHEVSHLVVVQPHSGHPVGVLSALDLAGVLAWGGTA